MEMESPVGTFAAAARRSFLQAGALWLLVYSSAYALLYVLFRKAARPWKLSEAYPPAALVRREVLRSLCSVFICSLLDALLTSAMDIGLLRIGAGAYPEGLAELVAATAREWRMVALVVLWADFHFYWVHRAVHECRWLYQHVHKVHHESFNPDPWSGLSFHPIEGALYFSSLFLVLIVPLDRWLYDALRFGLLLAPAGGHLGFGDPCFPWGYDHYVHNAKFNYNFAAGFLPWNGIWDNLCGTAYRAGSRATAWRLEAAGAQASAAGGRLEVEGRPPKMAQALAKANASDEGPEGSPAR